MLATLPASAHLQLPASAEWPTRVAQWVWTPAEPWAAELTLTCHRPGPKGGSTVTLTYRLQDDGDEWLFLPLNHESEIYTVRRHGGCTCKAGRVGRVGCKHAATVQAARDAGIIN